uniref:Cytokine-inducible SH2-containing protein n=1 Tax=Tetraodon nigroviridis TaxID=99883 RepID=H3DBB5_TETNG
MPAAPATEAPRGMRAGTVTPTACLQSTHPPWDPTKDLRAIASNFCYLENSGWYWGAVTAAQAHAALQEASEGAFLVRDSSHPLYMLTLSVRTARGPTSIRIQYSSARFLLDSSSPARPSLSSFPNVPSLVQHYMGPKSKAEEGELAKEAPSKSSQESVQSASVVMKLKRAVYKPHSLPSLQHLTRLVIHRHSECPEQLPLPKPLLRYLQDYPFKV